MAHHLVVISGADEGKGCEVTPDAECLIGRSPDAALRLSDESISWEHAVVTDEGGKTYIENLSALGTQVRGQKITRKTRLGSNDIVELSPTCQFRLDLAAAATTTQTSPLKSALLVVLAIVALGAAVMFMLPESTPSRGAPTGAHWQRAHLKLVERMRKWEAERQIPGAFVDQFEEAWRVERSGASDVAWETWDQLRFELMTLTVPHMMHHEGEIAPVRGSFAEAASLDEPYRALQVLMEWDPAIDPADPEWSLDRRYVEALVDFVRLRADRTEPDSMKKRRR